MDSDDESDDYKYEITYDYFDECENCERHIVEDFDGKWSEMVAYLRQLRKNGCYNIVSTAITDD